MLLYQDVILGITAAIFHYEAASLKMTDRKMRTTWSKNVSELSISSVTETLISKLQVHVIKDVLTDFAK